MKIIIKISGSRPCRSILNYEATLRLIIKQSMARKLSNDDPTVSDNAACCTDLNLYCIQISSEFCPISSYFAANVSKNLAFNPTCRTPDSFLHLTLKFNGDSLSQCHDVTESLCSL